MKRYVTMLLVIVVFLSMGFPLNALEPQHSCSSLFVNAMNDFFAAPESYRAIGIDGDDITTEFFQMTKSMFEAGSYDAIKSYADTVLREIYTDISAPAQQTAPFATITSAPISRVVSYHLLRENYTGATFEAAYKLNASYYYNAAIPAITSGSLVYFSWINNPFDSSVTIGNVTWPDGFTNYAPNVTQNTNVISQSERSIVFTYKFTFDPVTIASGDTGAAFPVEFHFGPYAYTMSAAV